MTHSLAMQGHRLSVTFGKLCYRFSSLASNWPLFEEINRDVPVLFFNSIQNSDPMPVCQKQLYTTKPASMFLKFLKSLAV